jgi:hypothetical protein
MDVSVAAHFARQEAVDFLRTAVFLQLNEAEKKKIQKLRKEYGGVKALTNPETHFVADIYARAVQCG